MKAAFALGLAVLAVFLGGGPSVSAKWKLQSAINVVWRSLGIDVRVRREYQREFPEYAPYNFSSKSWVPIDRKSLASLSAQEFKEKYVKQRVPVILTDIEPREKWSLADLQDRCGQMPVTFDRLYAAGLRAIPRWMRKLFLDHRLLEAYNTTTDDVLKAMDSMQMTLGSYLSLLEKDKQIIANAKESTRRTESPLYSGQIVDYLFPFMLTAQHMDRRFCKSLVGEAKAVLRRLIDFAA